MPEPTERFTFANTRVVSQVEVIDDQVLMFVDQYIDDDLIVTTGWNADRSKFGVYVNGELIYPTREEPS